MLLAGDIGGTKTHLALFSAESDPHSPIVDVKYPSGNYDSLTAIVQQFLAETNAETITAAAFGVAGPVANNSSALTNLSWSIDGAAMGQQLDIPHIKLLNDLEATANAVLILQPKDEFVLNEGEAVPQATIGVIAPGTGLGMAFLTHDGNGYFPHPSEGGHSAFSPSNEFELGLLRYLFPKFDGHVSTERVCSGSGIPNIYDYLRDTGHAPEPDWLRDALNSAEDRTPIIVNNAVSDDPNPLCKATLDMFATILGAEVGDMALTYLATGGVYLGGGIPPRILPVLKSESFRYSFCNKGRFTAMMERIPLHVILNAEAALLGAARAVFSLNTIY